MNTKTGKAIMSQTIEDMIGQDPCPHCGLSFKHVILKMIDMETGNVGYTFDPRLAVTCYEIQMYTSQVGDREITPHRRQLEVVIVTDAELRDINLKGQWGL